MKAKKIVEKPIKNTGSRAEKTLIKKLSIYFYETDYKFQLNLSQEIIRV